MGIIVTTLIMTVSCVLHNNNLSDQEIIEKAMELGMIMPESESESDKGIFGSHEKESSESDGDSETEGEPQSGSVDKEEPSESETNTEVEDSSKEPSESEKPIESEKPSESETPSESEETTTQTPPQHVEVTQYVLHIVWGDYPRKIANELYESGMIDNAKAFRNYLADYCEQNKKEIRVGTYTITKGMTYEEIAKIITKS